MYIIVSFDIYLEILFRFSSSAFALIAVDMVDGSFE